MIIYLPVNERIFEIFSYAFASFLYLCQSSHETQITQKNVNHNNHVNKDNSGMKIYTTTSSVNRSYFCGNCKSSLHHATSSCRAKMKWKHCFCWGSTMLLMAVNVPLLKATLNGVYIPHFFKGNELHLFCFFYYWNQSTFSFPLRLCCVNNWIKGTLVLSLAVSWAPPSGKLIHIHNVDSLNRTLHGSYKRQCHVGPLIYLPHDMVQYARLLQYLQWPCTG